MSKKNQYSYKAKTTDWGKVFRKTVNDITCTIMSFFGRPGGAGVGFCPNPAARICIYTLIGVTLLFSGLGIYSWIILIMLIIILQFV